MSDVVHEGTNVCPIHVLEFKMVRDDVADAKSEIEEIKEEAKTNYKALNEKLDTIIKLFNGVMIKVLVIVTAGLFAALIAILWFLLQELLKKTP